MRRKDGLHYRLVTLFEKIAARGSKPRVMLRIAVPTFMRSQGTITASAG